MCSGDRQSQGQELSVSEGESNGLQTVNLPTRGYGHAKEPWYIETPYRDELMPANRSKRVDNLQDAMFANRFIRHIVGYCFSKLLEHVPSGHCPDGQRVYNLQDVIFVNRIIRHLRGYCFSKILAAAFWSHCPDGLGELLALVLVGLRGLSRKVLGTGMIDDWYMVR